MTVKNTEGLIIVRILFLKKLILLDFLKFKFRLFYSIMADKNRELSSVKKSYLFLKKGILFILLIVHLELLIKINLKRYYRYLFL